MKSPDEISAIKEMSENKRKLKETRKQHQEENVKKKQLLKEELKKKSLEGMKKKSTIKYCWGKCHSNQQSAR
jgi:hypothetical protein